MKKGSIALLVVMKVYLLDKWRIWSQIRLQKTLRLQHWFLDQSL